MVALRNSDKKLAHLNIGDQGEVSHFTNERMASKLIAIGVLPGTRIQVIRKAPFGGGCYVKADNLLLALRRDEACCIILR